MIFWYIFKNDLYTKLTIFSVAMGRPMWQVNATDSLSYSALPLYRSMFS